MLDKVWTSYFYQIRFFSPRMIPFSTAVFDPKWYHYFRAQDNVFLDKRGVLNGLRFEELHPNKTCADLCRGKETCLTKDPQTCQFLINYGKQLDQIDFGVFIDNLDNFLSSLGSSLQIDKPLIPVFIVHEALDNQCSERAVLQKWFNTNGVLCEELPYPLNDYIYEFS